MTQCSLAATRCVRPRGPPPRRLRVETGPRLCRAGQVGSGLCAAPSSNVTAYRVVSEEPTGICPDSSETLLSVGTAVRTSDQTSSDSGWVLHSFNEPRVQWVPGVRRPECRPDVCLVLSRPCGSFSLVLPAPRRNFRDLEPSMFKVIGNLE
jgi:hypothetical protein